MILYLHHEEFNGQLNGDISSVTGRRPHGGRVRIMKYFLAVVISVILLSRPAFLLGENRYAELPYRSTNAVETVRPSLFAGHNLAFKAADINAPLESGEAAVRERVATSIEFSNMLPYFHALVFIFGFIIGVCLTALLIIASGWRNGYGSRGEAPQLASAGSESVPAAAGSTPAINLNGNQLPGARPAVDESLILKIGLLRDILGNMADRMEKLEALSPPQAVNSETAIVQEELEDLLLEADHLVNSLEDEVQSTEVQQTTEPAAKGAADCGCKIADENPEYTEMHAKARNLRAEGGRFLAENRTTEAMDRFEDSLSILLSLVKINPDNQLWRRDLVLAYHNMGRTMERLEMTQEALDYFEQALSLTRDLADQNPDSLDWQRGLAASYSHVGRISSFLGNFDDAWKNYDKELEIMRDLVDKQPENKAWQYALASAYHNMGQLLERRGQIREALDAFKKDQAVLKQLVDASPDNQCWLYDLACVHGQLARMYKDQGQLKDALGQARRYLGTMRRLSERDTENTAYRRELTVALGQVGRLLELRGEYDQARTTFKAALEIRRNLASMEPDNAVWQDDLLVCLYKLGDIYFAQKDYESAWRYYQEALELVDGLIEKDGRLDNWQMGKCGVLLRLGNLHQVHDSVTATNYYRSALDIAEEPHSDDDKESDWRELAGLIRKNMAQQERMLPH
ncbi:hypothetical protein C4J81_14355 [Deltaproteobacteria bacterium Smac51]|nr:hypothetical protein C4J81_14355 [Deltaproteobacteria bacterium Smac51]